MFSFQTLYYTVECETAHNCEGVLGSKSSLILWFPLNELKKWSEKWQQRDKYSLQAGNTPQSIKQSMLFQLCRHVW